MIGLLFGGIADWKQHGNEYYDCSKFKPDPSANVAKEALRRYLHYYERVCFTRAAARPAARPAVSGAAATPANVFF